MKPNSDKNKSAANQTVDMSHMTDKNNLYPNLSGLLESEKAGSESGNKSEISEPPPGYEDVFGSYISEG